MSKIFLFPVQPIPSFRFDPLHVLSVQKKVIKERKVSFKSLLKEQPSRTQIIVTFLAILELVHFNKIEVVQDESFGEIMIESKEPEGTEVKPFENIDLEI